MSINITLIGQMIFFGIFVWLCMKFVWPPLLSAMNDREEKIAKGLQAADRAEKDLALAQQKATQEIREGKEKAAAIIEMANKRANQIIDEAKQAAITEAERVKETKMREVEQTAMEAKEKLRQQVATLSILGASKILGATVDQKAHQNMLNDLAAEL